MNIGLLYIMATGLTSSISIEAVNNAMHVEYDAEEIAKVVFSLDDSCNASETQTVLSMKDYENFFTWNKSNKRITSEIKNNFAYNESIFDLILDTEIEKKDLYTVKDFNLKNLKSMPVEVESYILSKNGHPSKEDLNKIGSIYSLPEGLLYSVMIKESEGNKNAVSNKDARGLFQFMKETATDFGLIVNGKDYRTDEWRSAEASARYLSWIFTYFHPEKDRSDINNYKYVLAGYNAGIGVVKNRDKLSVPNYKETKDYVKYVIGYAKGDYYRVKKGDLFRKIAKDHDLEIHSLARMNNGVSQTTLKAGSYLLVNKNENYGNYVVQKGDSLYGIAKRHSVSVNEIKIVNSLSNNLIKIGQELTMPF
ncbi:MAG: hypothetical protein CL760_07195 [Chloroflexi bacterium]|nr:hypothetical protein [Chloroflexota bacterium]